MSWYRTLKLRSLLNKGSTLATMAENLRVQLSGSPKDMEASLNTLVKNERWLIGKCENELCYAADPHGSFIGVLDDGKKVSFVNIMNFGDYEHSYWGHYHVLPEHRHKGFGSKTNNMAWSMMPKRVVNCISTSVAKDMAPKLKERHGFEPVWTDCLFEFNARDIISLPCPDMAVSSYKEANFDELFEYDTSVFGFTRMSFLEKLVEICEGWVAMDEKGDITGYCSVREAAIKDYGWYLGPLYANDVTIAQCLLVQAAKFVLRSQSSASKVLSCYMPEINQEGIKFARTHFVERVPYNLLRMFSTSSDVITKNSKERVFAMTSPTLGG